MLIRRTENEITLSGANLGLADLKINLGSFIDKPIELVKASEVAIALDDSQYLLCKTLFNMSCESIDVPAGQTTTDLRPKMNKVGGTSSASSDTPIIINFPLTARPPNTSPIAFPLGTVPRMILAPPSLTSSSTVFCDLLSI
jgi:hypothetical protein